MLKHFTLYSTPICITIKEVWKIIFSYYVIYFDFEQFLIHNFNPGPLHPDMGVHFTPRSESMCNLLAMHWKWLGCQIWPHLIAKLCWWKPQRWVMYHDWAPIETPKVRVFGDLKEATLLEKFKGIKSTFINKRCEILLKLN